MKCWASTPDLHPMPHILRIAGLFLVAMLATFAAETQVEHLVMFKWKEGTTPEQTEAIAQALRGLATQIPGIVSLDYGAQISPEPVTKTKGFQDGLVVVFTDAAARDAYIVHPAHQAALKLIVPNLADVAVLDFARKP
jgi:Stress responsive A/B Barrel Domain